MSREQAVYEAGKFLDYWRASTRDAQKLDWPATWRNWVRRALERPTGRPTTRSTGPPPRVAGSPDDHMEGWDEMVARLKREEEQEHGPH